MTQSSQVPSRCDKDTDRHFRPPLVSERSLPNCPLLYSFFISLCSPALFLLLWISFFFPSQMTKSRISSKDVSTKEIIGGTTSKRRCYEKFGGWETQSQGAGMTENLLTGVKVLCFGLHNSGSVKVHTQPQSFLQHCGKGHLGFKGAFH